MPDAASFRRANETLLATETMLTRFPENEYVIGIPGFDLLSSTFRANAGSIFMTMKDWGERQGAGQDSFGRRQARPRGQRPGEGRRGGHLQPAAHHGTFDDGRRGGLPAEPKRRGSQALGAQVAAVVEAAKGRAEFASVQTTFKPTVPQVYLEVDRAKAKAIGVPINSVFDALQATFGSLYVNDFNKFGRTYKVQIQSESDFRAYPDDIRNVFVRSQSGDMIPLNVLVKATPPAGRNWSSGSTSSRLPSSSRPLPRASPRGR